MLFAALASCSPKQSKQTASDTAVVTEPESAIDFGWRQHQGDFPQDKPGYLITEDVLTYSKVLPQFVKQKEAMGFRVDVATEKDYGTDMVLTELEVHTR